LEKVLVVSSAQKGEEIICEMLKQTAYSNIIIARNSGEARRLTIEDEYDFCIINTPLSDEFGMELAECVSVSTNSGVIMLVRSEISDEVSSKAENFGIFVVSKPISKAIFYQSLKMLLVARKRVLGLKNENNLLKNKIDEIRLVDRAKCALIQYLNMTEPSAHRYIEKQAMDMRISRKQVAEGILKTYEI